MKYLLVALALLIMSCHGQHPESRTEHITEEKLKEPLIDANKLRIKKEDLRIAAFIKRKRWDMQTSGTGLRYSIYQNGAGELPVEGSTVIINYELLLMDGTLCYSSDSNGTKGIRLGKSEVENGLDEALRLMRVGDKAKIIIPSHLAFGLMGDGDRIPSYAVLIYDLELIDIK